MLQAQAPQVDLVKFVWSFQIPSLSNICWISWIKPTSSDRYIYIYIYTHVIVNMSHQNLLVVGYPFQDVVTLFCCFVFFVCLPALSQETAGYLCQQRWGSCRFPKGFGRPELPEERLVQELDARTGGKLTEVSQGSRMKDAGCGPFLGFFFGTFFC